jgi:predicted MFS family arabinose efflux permease
MAGILSERGKLLPIVVATALFLLNAAFILVSKAFVKNEDVPRSASDSPAAVEDRSTPLRYPAWLGAFLIYAVMGVIFNVFPVFARDELALSESSIGFLLMIRAAATTVGFLILGKVTFWQFKRAALPILSVATVATLIALAFQRNALGFSLGFGIIGLLQSMIYNNSLFYATSGSPDRDRRASTHEAVLTFGQVVGSVSGGFLYQAFSMPVVYAVLGLLLGVGAAAQSAMIYRPGRRKAPAR